MKKITALVVVGILAGAAGMAAAKSPGLSILKSSTSDYQCNDGTQIKVGYYTLSDKSISFVKLKLDGSAYTLPRVISASGDRYTDLHKIEWWSKGDSASLNKEVYDEKSASIECKVMSAAKK